MVKEDVRREKVRTLQPSDFSLNTWITCTIR